MNAFGIDISKWNIKDNVTPDWAKVKASCSFVAIRSGVSWGYTDPWFVHNWAGAQGMCRMAYHVVYFGEDATKQMDNLFKIVQPADWKDTTAKCINIIEQRTGRRPILYSRASWVNQNLNVLAMPICDWWLAQYKYALPYPLYTPEATSPPALPTGVSDWLIHQTGEKFSGASVGVSSYYVDSNRWNGDVHSVLDYFGFGEVEPDVPMSDSEKLNTLWAWYEESHHG